MNFHLEMSERHRGKIKTVNEVKKNFNAMTGVNYFLKVSWISTENLPLKIVFMTSVRARARMHIGCLTWLVMPAKKDIESDFTAHRC